ncbi:hypothetical protein O6H91_10G063500 [Diphasiastrum complanatum]|uniref:Uncharacterized protein n=4 Tax=Diphasiastrum complanatum TaxID=34168 RepID=A0ACC2CGA5_DIPCM|nr:hypothetical protein O6H91_10G042600 [Diphasiastrum complanatum]KAJ7541510.1 hypothetical protein O6H91_10G063500 [Diphasiastrum complanatum]
MAAAVVRVKETRAMLKALGPRPNATDIEQAHLALKVIDEHLQSQLQNIVRAQIPEQFESSLQADKESQLRRAAEEEKLPYLSVLRLNELLQLYEGMILSADMEFSGGGGVDSCPRSPMRPLYIKDEVPAEVAQLLQEAYENQLHNLNLNSRQLTKLPDSFGKISSLVVLNLSNNRLEVLPDSISRLNNLINLDLSSNHLDVLPESFGELRKLKVLNVSGNVLKYLPESICRCRALVDLNASFNRIDYLPPNLGSELVNLERLSVQLNKLSSLPSSLGQLKPLKHLEVQFNKLLSLPETIGNLTNLETLDVSSNFTSLVSLPNAIGDLVSLTSLDLSYNQLRELPVSLGRLQKLKKLKLNGNPLTLPPAEVIEHSHEAVMEYMAVQWKASLVLDDHDSNNNSKANNAKVINNTKMNNYWSRPDSPAAAHRRRVGDHSGSWMTGWLQGMCGRASFFHRGSKGKLMEWQQHSSEDFL